MTLLKNVFFLQKINYFHQKKIYFIFIKKKDSIFQFIFIFSQHILMKIYLKSLIIHSLREKKYFPLEHQNSRFYLFTFSKIFHY